MNSCSKIEHRTSDPATGYLEGYYGKLLSWSDRAQILNRLESLGMNTFCYAPKEDPRHRLTWREQYDATWRSSFQQFCAKATASSVSVLAGIAPGLDFNFDHFGANSDFEKLTVKAKQLCNDGASNILVLWDDINDVFAENEQQLAEGTAHARVVNELSNSLGCPIWTVPRVYASDIENNNQYRELFFSELNTQHPVLICGNAIVVSQATPKELNIFAQSDRHGCEHRLILWDNFYANDYCPRRLFVGPWTGRDDIGEYLLNPTGMPFTDELLLDITRCAPPRSGNSTQWEKTLRKHGVPEAFLTLAPYFSAPTFGDKVEPEDIQKPATIDEAIEECLWRWKSPLAREWYPFIMSLKHDLALLENKLPEDRILKTQSPALAKRLMS